MPEGGGLARLGIHLPSLIVFLVNFALLLLILYFAAYKPILRLLDQRSQRIRGALEEAERARREAAQVREEMERQVEEARREGQRLLEEARRAAERYREEERQRARQEVEAFLKRARQEIERERDAAIEEVRRQFADLALRAAEKVVERSLDRQAHQDLIERVLAESESLRRE